MRCLAGSAGRLARSRSRPAISELAAHSAMPLKSARRRLRLRVADSLELGPERALYRGDLGDARAHQPHRQVGQVVVALAVRDPLDRLALACALGVLTGREPTWRRRQRAVRLGQPDVFLAARVDTRRRHDVTTGAPELAIAERDGADRLAGEVEMPAARRRDLRRAGLLELGQLVADRLEVVYVEHLRARLAAGDPDIGVGPLAPPLADFHVVGGGVLDAVARQRGLTGRRDRQHGPAEPGQRRAACRAALMPSGQAEL